MSTREHVTHRIDGEECWCLPYIEHVPSPRYATKVPFDAIRYATDAAPSQVIEWLNSRGVKVVGPGGRSADQTGALRVATNMGRYEDVPFGWWIIPTGGAWAAIMHPDVFDYLFAASPVAQEDRQAAHPIEWCGNTCGKTHALPAQEGDQR